jgi:hypothetical protein
MAEKKQNGDVEHATMNDLSNIREEEERRNNEWFRCVCHAGKKCAYCLSREGKLDVNRRQDGRDHQAPDGTD